jgi:hypothetical protein
VVANNVSSLLQVGVLIVKTSLHLQRIELSNIVGNNQSRGDVTDPPLVDASAQKVVSSWTVGPDLPDQQCGNVWIGENEIASVSVGGDINVYDKRQGNEPAMILYVRYTR